MFFFGLLASALREAIHGRRLLGCRHGDLSIVIVLLSTRRIEASPSQVDA
jgi:hypothetical protein